MRRGHDQRAREEERAQARQAPRSGRLAENVPAWQRRRAERAEEDSPRSRQLLRLTDPPAAEPAVATAARRPSQEDPLVVYEGREWRLCPDGSLKRWDVAAGTWTTMGNEEWSEDEATYLTRAETAQDRVAVAAAPETAAIPSRDGTSEIPGCTCLGGTLPSLCLYGKYTLVVERGSLGLRSRQAGTLTIPMEEIVEIQVGGRGRLEDPAPGRESFAMAGALDGMAAAAVVRSLVARTRMDTSITVVTETGEAAFHCDRLEPEAVRASLAPLAHRLRRRAKAAAGEADPTRDLIHLADLKTRGLLTEQEFASAVAAALDGTL